MSYAIAHARQLESRPLWSLPTDFEDCSLQDFLRWSRGDPPDLDPALAGKVRSLISRKADGRHFQRDQHGHKHMSALPLEVGQLRHAGATRSVWRARLQEWLASDAGAAWKARRDMIVDPDALSGEDV